MIQVYVTWPSTNLVVPRIQLVAFTRSLVRAGEHRLLNLVITPERYAVWGDNGWTYIKGNLKCKLHVFDVNRKHRIQSKILEIH